MFVMKTSERDDLVSSVGGDDRIGGDDAGDGYGAGDSTVADREASVCLL